MNRSKCVLAFFLFLGPFISESAVSENVLTRTISNQPKLDSFYKLQGALKRSGLEEKMNKSGSVNIISRDYTYKDSCRIQLKKINNSSYQIDLFSTSASSEYHVYSFVVQGNGSSIDKLKNDLVNNLIYVTGQLWGGVIAERFGFDSQNYSQFSIYQEGSSFSFGAQYLDGDDLETCHSKSLN